MKRALLALALSCMGQQASCSSPTKQRVARHWPECSTDELHVDTADRHRCAEVLRMRCKPVATVEGSTHLCGMSGLASNMACAADCPCGLTDFGTDRDDWRQCGRIVEDWSLYP